MNGQLDLFGTVSDEPADVAWAQQFERADWVAPWDTACGMRAGESRLGWRCPDPDCAVVEPSAFCLSINHGFDPNVPGRQPWNGRCYRASRRGVLRQVARLTVGGAS